MLNIRKLFWTIFIGLPIFFGFLSYRWLPQEYDERNHILIESHSIECGPEGFNSCEEPTIWKDRKTGEVYKASDFKSHRLSESFRISVLSFIYGLVGCLFFAWDERKSNYRDFGESFKYALMINGIVVAFIFIVI